MTKYQTVLGRRKPDCNASAAADAAQGSRLQADLTCPDCGVDRLKAPCPRMADECAMTSDAHLLAAHCAPSAQGEQRVWIVDDAKGEPVMMCSVQPSCETLTKVSEKIGMACTVTEYMLRPASLATPALVAKGELMAIPANLREFVEAVADPGFSYIDRETDQTCCNGCNCAEVYVSIDEPAKEVHADDCIVLRARAILAAPVAPSQPQRANMAALDVLVERGRQIEREGYDHQNDDAHVMGELGAYAAFYAMPPATREWPASETGYGETWGEAIVPADWMAPKPGDRRGELVKAGALILAEIERIDRAVVTTAEKGGA